MIEIRTTGDISLDLDPNCAFDIEIEQPMLDDTRIPVAYSTSISFLPTLNNKKVFGFLNAMMLAPTVKKLEAYMYVSGVQLFCGVLEYDGLENGMINYTFSGRSFEDSFQTSIHEVKHLTKLEGSYANIGTALNMIKEARNGANEEFGAPQLLGEANIADIEFKNSMNLEPVSIPMKYHNWVWDEKTLFTPAVRVCKILSEAFQNTTIDEVLEETYNQLAILGMYKDEASFSRFGIPYYEGDDKYVFDIANTLPKITILDLVSNVAKMLCATIFRDGYRYVLKANKSVLESDNVLDWDSKVLDSFSATEEEPAAYTFGYANDDSENTYDVTGLSNDSENGNIIEADTLYSTILQAGNKEDYSAVRNTKTGDMFSGKKIEIFPEKGSSIDGIYLDMLLHSITPIEENTESENSFDNSVSFKCVRCMPVETHSKEDYNISERKYTMSPIVAFPAIGSDRQEEVWIGLLLNNQLVDKGITFVWPNSYDTPYTLSIDGPVTEPPGGSTDLPFKGYPKEEYKEMSIAPSALYNRYHNTFAAWVGRRRQIITADVNLTLADIANLRMYNKVSFRNRVFLIKKISLSFAVRSNAVDISAVFIEC